ncbi:MAG: UPF0182 family protein, partial [Steroidobacteraceae bacterium]
MNYQAPRGPRVLGQDRAPRRRRTGLIVLAIVAAVYLGGGGLVSYYVEALWFDALGYGSVFWTRLNLQAEIFALFGVLSFGAVYGGYRLLKPTRFDQLVGGRILVNQQWVQLPIEPALNLIALGLALVVGFANAASMASSWTSFALYLHAPTDMATALAADPIFGRPLGFYLFTLPVWQLIAGWLLTLSVIVCVMAGLFVLASARSQPALERGLAEVQPRLWRGAAIALALLLLVAAVRVYLGRYERMFQDFTIFSGVNYTDAHVTLTGALVIGAALLVGALIALAGSLRAPGPRWLLLAALPAVACYFIVGLVAWYVSSFIVKPNQLVRERPYIRHNIEMTRRAYALDRVESHPFPAETGVAALDAADNQATLSNIRLWDWRALQDTLRQIQEIRTYYGFPDLDIDRYMVGGAVRQMMLAVRELNIDKLPASSRNWINEKLIYTHGYGVTMNPVDGFTPEGLPELVLSNMPIQSTV